MAKQINFSYKGTDYCLEFTRKSIKQMEDSGFVAEDITKKPVTLLPALFSGAFKAHHKYVKQEVIDEIYANMPDKDKLIEKLAEMYNEPLLAMMDEPTDEAKKVDWMTNW